MLFVLKIEQFKAEDVLSMFLFFSFLFLFLRENKVRGIVRGWINGQFDEVVLLSN